LRTHSHSPVSKSQIPLPEHLFGHTFFEQSAPVHSGWHPHVPLLQTPCEEQSPGQSISEQSTPFQPLSQRQPTVGLQIPLLLHELGQTRVAQSLAPHPSSHSHFPFLQTPCCEQSFTQMLLEQSVPVYPSPQKQTPLWQTPLSLQLLGQSASEQSTPCQPASHTQERLSEHTPWPEHHTAGSSVLVPLGHRLILQSSPRKPTSHLQCPSDPHLPCIEQSLGHER